MNLKLFGNPSLWCFLWVVSFERVMAHGFLEGVYLHYPVLLLLLLLLFYFVVFFS